MKEIVVNAPPFSSDSAYDYIKTQVDFGPRNMNTKGHDACAKWLIEKAFRISQDVYSYYTANGNTSSTAVESGNTVFQMAQVAGSEEIAVYVDGVLQTSGYNVRRESKKVLFDTAPAANSEIKIAVGIPRASAMIIANTLTQSVPRIIGKMPNDETGSEVGYHDFPETKFPTEIFSMFSSLPAKLLSNCVLGK